MESNLPSSSWSKSVRKKLRQIEELKTQMSEGIPMNPQQKDKLRRERELRRQLLQLQSPFDSSPPSPSGAPGDGAGDGSRVLGSGTSADKGEAAVLLSKAGAPLVQGGASGRGKKRKRPRLSKDASLGLQWLKKTVTTKGPILLSMLGRLYLEAHMVPFKQATGISIDAMLEQHAGSTLMVKQGKGAEKLCEDPAATELLLTTVGDAPPPSCKLRTRADAGEDLYQAGDVVLSVGEGDFTWSASIATMMGSAAKNLTATSYEDEITVRRKFGSASLKTLSALNARVAHGVDATKLKPEKRHRYDSVCFHFPHTGSELGLEESIKSNRKLLRGFFRAAGSLIKKRGEIHVTLVHRYPYTTWRAQSEADRCGGVKLQYCGVVPFDSKTYKGYKHVTSTLEGRESRYELESAFTHVWCREPAL